METLIKKTFKEKAFLNVFINSDSEYADKLRD